MVAKFWGQTYKVRIRWWWHAEVDQLHYLQCTYNPLLRTCVIECWWRWWWYEDGGDYDDYGDDVQVPCQLCDGIAGTITAHLTPRKRPHRFVPLMVVFVVMIMFWDLLWSSPYTSSYCWLPPVWLEWGPQRRDTSRLPELPLFLMLAIIINIITTSTNINIVVTLMNTNIITIKNIFVTFVNNIFAIISTITHQIFRPKIWSIHPW